MKTLSDDDALEAVGRFDRAFFDPSRRFKAIGTGSIGGKAHGLALAQAILDGRFPRERFPSIEVSIPSLTVVRTDVFDAFIERNGLDGAISDERSDDAIARAFQRADLPAEIAGDLRALVEQVRSPLAVRSSSLLEDALSEPFAGVYQTKMLPNNQPDPDHRFRRLVEAIKLVWASTFFRGAREYRLASSGVLAREKMAVIIQEVVGRRFGERFYPHVSGVARSFNYYPAGSARPEDGVANMALGLGKTIVDGGTSWSWSPRFPANPPPFASTQDLLERTQTTFWAVNMGKPPAWDPIRETEYLTQGTLADAEHDGSLGLVASTFDPQTGRISIGTGTRGTRVLDFAMLLVLREVPANDLVSTLLRLCEDELEGPVEIEFAMTFDPVRLGFLQVRPMAVSSEIVSLTEDDLERPDLFASSDQVMGNGVIDTIHDIVYLRPETFETKHTPLIASQLAAINHELVSASRPYLLIGFGRWGSADPWLGVPVIWSQISGARAVVETTTAGVSIDMSQGSHFFHNLMAFRVPYFTIGQRGAQRLDWGWLEKQNVEQETELVRHVSLDEPISIRVDGRYGRGVMMFRKDSE